MTPDTSLGAVVLLTSTAAVCFAVALDGLARRGGILGMRAALTLVASSAAVASICLLGAAHETQAAQALRWHVGIRAAMGGLGAGSLGAAAALARWRPARPVWIALGCGASLVLGGAALALQMTPAELVRTPISWFPTNAAVRLFDAVVIAGASLSLVVAAVVRLRSGARYGRRVMKLLVAMQGVVALMYFAVRMWAPPFAMQAFGVSLTGISAIAFWVLLRNWRATGVGIEAYQFLFRALSLPAVAVDLHTDAAILNPAASKLFGTKATALDAVRKLGLGDSVEEALRGLGGKRLGEVKVEGVPDRQFELLVHHDPDEDIGLLVLMDVTERALHARDLSHTLSELRQMQERLITQEKMAALGVLVAGVNHEINNPLAYASANLRSSKELAQSLLEGIALARRLEGSGPEATALREWARREEVLEAERDLLPALREAEDGCARIQTTVASMKLLSRQGESEERIDLAEAIHAGVRIGRTNLAQGVEVEVTVEGPLSVRGEAGDLSRLVTNLLVNAGHAVGARGRIDVRAWSEGGEAVLQVEDDGPGVPQALRARIFEPFFTTKSPGVGTGLGLAIGWETARRHRGCLRLVEGKGSGACFELRVPLSPA